MRSVNVRGSDHMNAARITGAMRQRILGSHTPPCHRHMVITGGGGGGLVRCGPATIAPAAPAPRSLLSQFMAYSRGHRPTSQSICVLVPSSLAGVWALGSWGECLPDVLLFY